jgi:hypothetical protein
MESGSLDPAKLHGMRKACILEALGNANGYQDHDTVPTLSYFIACGVAPPVKPDSTYDSKRTDPEASMLLITLDQGGSVTHAGVVVP